MMIFATVGTQLPFDRLIRELDEWAGANPKAKVFAQVGMSDYEPGHLSWARTLTQKQFSESMSTCDVVVAHAGMGTIISGVEQGKRVVVMPRQAEFGEHRNDHQLATVKRLGHIKGLQVAHPDTGLSVLLDQIRDAGCSQDAAGEPALSASPGLISEIRLFAGLAAH